MVVVVITVLLVGIVTYGFWIYGHCHRIVYRVNVKKRFSNLV